jgi:hypothetical protein
VSVPELTRTEAHSITNRSDTRTSTGVVPLASSKNSASKDVLNFTH